MKKSLAIIILFTLLTGCITYAVQEDYGKLEAVQEVKLKKNLIYDKIMVYIATQYTSPKKVMEYNDKDQGIITFNGAALWNQPGNFMYNYYLNYKITIHIKDTKYRIEMTPLHFVYNTAPPQTGTPVKEMAAAYTAEFNKLDKEIYQYVSGQVKFDDF